jgi:hypothetical protein
MEELMPRAAYSTLFIVSVLCVSMATFAQTPSLCGVQAPAPMIYGSPKSNSPFGATLRTTHEQKLVDGNAIRGVIETHVFRDSAGTTRTESSSGQCEMGEDGQMKPPLTINIQDFVAHSMMSWQVNGRNKIVRVLHQGDPRSLPAASESTPVQNKINALIQQYWGANNHTEKLGSRIIAGLQCDGTKHVRTIPAGEEGNDLPMQMIEEMWVARDLGLVVLEITDDTRMGHTVSEVTDISLAEPVASLFVPPPDYKIEEQPIRAATTHP